MPNDTTTSTSIDALIDDLSVKHAALYAAKAALAKAAGDLHGAAIAYELAVSALDESPKAPVPATTNPPLVPSPAIGAAGAVPLFVPGAVTLSGG
ncbi:MAG TPA: hypothetical protein VGI39_05450 [Polyangiaceae bacterium]